MRSRGGGSFGVVVFVSQAEALGQALNFATVLECATHRRLVWKLVEIKRFFGPSLKSSLRCALIKIFFFAAVLISKALLLAQKHCFRHGRSVTLSCINKRLSKSPVEWRGL